MAGGAWAEPPFPPGNLRVEVQELEDRIATLEEQIATLLSTISDLQSNPVLALEPYVSVDTTNEIMGVAPPHIIFSEANVHVQSGSGYTDDGGSPTGLGNLIVGYNEEANRSGCQRTSRLSQHHSRPGIPVYKLGRARYRVPQLDQRYLYRKMPFEAFFVLYQSSYWKF